MDLTHLITPANVIAACLALVPFLAVAFFSERLAGSARALPVWAQLACPALVSVPYLVVACAAGNFRWGWFALYAALPVTIAFLLWQVAQSDAEQRGGWQDFLILAVLGLAVDLRWFEGAWPAHLAIFNKVLLLDTGIYGFVLVRNLGGTGFDLRLRWRDAAFGLRELVFYVPIALGLGLSLGFLHLHVAWPGLGAIGFAWIFTFFFIAVPEELFFRGWLQNLLERRMGRLPALLLTSVLFGLAHFNKRAVHFNWRYVLLAALAGIFYGRAWRQERRVGASAVTHASVDALWSLWLK
ncbi:MAG TPA: CPBP family intramembrane glutamic endopeptidase [Terracidiphilus sp.]|jgi:CAAX protease family protein|nr:CPBP family intramembrane glutamic endopeptidase [Terracidiphilus sp.]HUX28193.1 CPBP family intramembrane glutamic endopeptidase [Terracidiphilus sp.]